MFLFSRWRFWVVCILNGYTLFGRLEKYIERGKYIMHCNTKKILSFFCSDLGMPHSGWKSGPKSLILKYLKNETIFRDFQSLCCYEMTLWMEGSLLSYSYSMCNSKGWRISFWGSLVFSKAIDFLWRSTKIFADFLLLYAKGMIRKFLVIFWSLF